MAHVPDVPSTPFGLAPPGFSEQTNVLNLAVLNGRPNLKKQVEKVVACSTPISLACCV